jgi:hypothetical protein
MSIAKQCALAALSTLLVAGASFAVFPGTAVGGGAVAPAAPQADLQVQLGPEEQPESQYLGTTQFTCTTFTAAGTGAAILDRDNTGAGREALRIDVTDGLGTSLYTLTFDNTLGTYVAGLINTTPYTVAPASNPLTMKLTSLAGNGLPEQVDYVAQGGCANLPTWPGIPTVSPAGLAALGALLLGAGFFAIRRLRRARAAA